MQHDMQPLTLGVAGRTSSAPPAPIDRMAATMLPPGQQPVSFLPCILFTLYTAGLSDKLRLIALLICWQEKIGQNQVSKGWFLARGLHETDLKVMKCRSPWKVVVTREDRWALHLQRPPQSSHHSRR